VCVLPRLAWSRSSPRVMGTRGGPTRGFTIVLALAPETTVIRRSLLPSSIRWTTSTSPYGNHRGRQRIADQSETHWDSLRSFKWLIRQSRIYPREKPQGAGTGEEHHTDAGWCRSSPWAPPPRCRIGSVTTESTFRYRPGVRVEGGVTKSKWWWRSITRSPDPPAAGATPGSSGRGPWRS
jgi:hypothetical protein